MTASPHRRDAAPRLALPLALTLVACADAPGAPTSATTTTSTTTAAAASTTGASSSTATSSADASTTADATATAAAATTNSTGTDTADTTDTSAPTTCPCFAGDGPYCGQSVADHAGEAGCEVPSLAGHEGDLLACAAGEWAVQEACAEGCLSTTPGESDACQLPLCACFVKVAWCGSGAAEHGQGLDPPCRVPLVPEHNGDILGCEGPDWIVKQKCPKGCHENQMGIPDTCNDDSLYLLPYACGDAFTCSQGNFGSSHQGSQAYAWDFAMPKGTPVHAARAGVVAYAEVRSPPGSPCYDPPGLLESCHNKANFVGVRHADGTVALYMHLRQLAVGEGDVVAQGDVIGLSGNSGYTSGPHLHFQLQNDCGIWFCQSVPVSFADAPALAKGKSATSGNCP